MKFRMLVALAAVVFGSCASSTIPPDKLTDPRIAMIVRIINLSEVREADLAREKASSTEVRDYATTMVSEHSADASKADAALNQADIPAEDTPRSHQLDAASGAAVQHLQTLSGAAFDRAYIDREVQAHQEYLTLIDSQLTPHARRKALKQQLTDLRNTEDKHLTQARKIQANLPK